MTLIKTTRSWCCLVLLASAGLALDPLVTEDGFGLVFAGESDPRVSGVTIDGVSVSGRAEAGGFKLSYFGENTASVGANLLTNGDLDDLTGWKTSGSPTVAEQGRVSGHGAVCLTPGSRLAQSVHLTDEGEGGSRVYGLRMSGWSNASDVDGEVGSSYSLYMDVTYADGTHDYGLTVDFDVGTHGYQYKEAYYEMNSLVSKVWFYVYYKNKHKTGTVCFDDVALEAYSVPTVSTGTIGKTSDGVYTQVSTMYDSKLTAEYKAEKDHIRINGTLLNTRAGLPNRSVTVAFSVPVDTSDGWFWGSGLEVDNISAGGAVASNRNYASSANVPFLIDKIPLVGISSASRGIGLGIKLGSVFGYRLTFGGVQGHLTITMEFSLTSLSRIADSAWFEFVLFRVDQPSAAAPFRAALDKYCKKVFAEPYMRRVIREQGLWMPFDAIEDVSGWEDFGFRFFEGQRAKSLAFNTRNGILNYPYIEPTLLHHDFTAATAAGLVELLEGCDTVECAATLTSYIADESGAPRYYEENADWNTGCRLPVNSNPGVPGRPNMAEYCYGDVDAFYGLENENTTVDGIYVDSLESFCLTLDYRGELFGVLGATPLYDKSGRPCTVFCAWTFDFLGALAAKLRAEKRASATIMANGIFNNVPHMAMYADVSGVETTWLRDGAYSALKHERMFYYRMNAFQKPYLFLQNSDFTRWTYDMTQRYMESALLYGIWPGFFSPDAATARYFKNAEAYNRDRPLFRRYMPYFRLITAQGWEPITCVAAARVGGANDTEFYAERWGGGSHGEGSGALPFYITARAESATANSDATYRLAVDVASMGVAGYSPRMVFTVKEILQTNATAVNKAAAATASSGLEFDFTFKMNTTYVFEVTGEEGESGSSGDDDNGDRSSSEQGNGVMSVAPIAFLVFVVALFF